MFGFSFWGFGVLGPRVILYGEKSENGDKTIGILLKHDVCVVETTTTCTLSSITKFSYAAKYT